MKNADRTAGLPAISHRMMDQQAGLKGGPETLLLRAAKIIILILFSAVQSQSQPQSQSPHHEVTKHTIKGTVINSVTGLPIARALVELDAESVRYAITDGSGDFQFEEVEETSVTIAAERTGFLKPAARTTESDEGTISFQLSANVEGIVLKLVPQGELDGQVGTTDGAPIPDLPVRIYERIIVDGQFQWHTSAFLSTDEEGRFRMFGVLPGLFVVSVGPERWRARPSLKSRAGYPWVFYPNAHELSSASLISVSAGQRVDVEIKLSQEPLFEVSGAVIGLPPAVEAPVQLLTSAGEAMPLKQVHPELHDFSAFVPAGEYALRTTVHVGDQLWQATMPLAVDSDASGIEIKPKPLAPILVRIDYPESTSGEGPSANVRLVSTKAILRDAQFATRAVANRDRGTMEIVGVEPSSYSVEITPFDAYVKTASSAQTDLQESDLLVPNDTTIEPVSIVLARDGGKVSGHVLVRENDSHVGILLVPAAGSTRQIRLAIMENAGGFQFEQVRPGDYLLLAFERVANLEYRNPDVLSAFLSRAVRISVAPRQMVNTILEPIRWGK